MTHLLLLVCRWEEAVADCEAAILAAECAGNNIAAGEGRQLVTRIEQAREEAKIAQAQQGPGPGMSGGSSADAAAATDAATAAAAAAAGAQPAAAHSLGGGAVEQPPAGPSLQALQALLDGRLPGCSGGSEQHEPQQQPADEAAWSADSLRVGYSQARAASCAPPAPFQPAATC